MPMWRYRADSDRYQTLALVDSEKDVHWFMDYVKGRRFPRPWPSISVYYEREWEDTSLEESQRAYLARRGLMPRGDFPSLFGTEPIFTERARQILGPWIEKAVEFIPLHCGEETLYMVNVVDVVDCLDRKLSTIKWISGGAIYKVDHYVIKDKLLGGKHMFKIPKLWASIYVSDEFKKVVEDSGLKGLIWKPLP